MTLRTRNPASRTLKTRLVPGSLTPKQERAAIKERLREIGHLEPPSIRNISGVQGDVLLVNVGSLVVGGQRKLERLAKELRKVTQRGNIEGTAKRRILVVGEIGV